MFIPTWLTPGSPLGAIALATALGRRVQYRMHTIETRLVSGGAVAIVYSGDTVIYRAHDANEIDALLRAQQWIDERAEYATEHDLTAEQRKAA